MKNRTPLSPKRRRVAVASLLTAGMIGIPVAAYAADAISNGSSAVTESGMYRFASDDRYKTAVEISKASFTSASTVYLANGEKFPDALAAGPVAAKVKAPLLLTGSDGVLNTATAAEIKRLGATKVIILGSEGTIAPTVETAVKGLGVTVQRLGGVDRYETAQKILASTFSGYSGTVYLSNGEKFPDALSGGSVAAMEGAPVLLVNPNGELSPFVSAALKSMNPTKYVVLGSEGSLSQAQVNQITGIKGAPVTRLGGSDRYETSALVSASQTKVGATVFVATGEKFPDALAGVASAAVNGAPILLAVHKADGSCLTGPVAAEFDRINPTKVVLLGGENSVSTDAVEYLCD